MKVAIVGCGSRHQMYRNALTGPYADRHDLVALCDSNPVRLELSLEATGPATRGYGVADFDKMLRETQPDTVIVCTPDSTHADFIVQALEAGCDTICEKPLATTAEQLDRIQQAQTRSGRRVTVTFNYRYTPARSQIKRLLKDGAIGQVQAVTFRWALDQVHGGDYFRRWHRQTANSGGLFVHKASHHFDLLSWWLDSAPTSVAASSGKRFYTPDRAQNLGLGAHADRCSDCGLVDTCGFALKLDDSPNLSQLYKSAEGADGYFRDRCVFAEGIDMADTYQAHLWYASGATCTYSLVTYAPWEGFEVTFMGTEGELRHRHQEVHGIFGGTRPVAQQETLETTLLRPQEEPQDLVVETATGDHSGGDARILEDLFGDGVLDDPLERRADHSAGARAAGTGIAAASSALSGQVEPIRFP